MLGLYIHFPWCFKKCPYCDFNAYDQHRHQADYDSYVSALIKDLLTMSWFLQKAPVTSIYLGGGTPSLCPPLELKRLFESIKKFAQLSPDCEVTMEVSPMAEKRLLAAFLEIGVNRFSVGIQSFDDSTLKRLGREHHQGQAFQIVQDLKDIKALRVNLDIIYGVDTQNKNRALTDLKTAIDAGFEHLSWYELMIEPNTVFAKYPHYKASVELIEEIQEEGAILLSDAGFHHYEVSAYTRGKTSQHNALYWRYGDYIGIGAGAHSKITLRPFQTLRFYKTRYPKDYVKSQRVLFEDVVDDGLDYLLNRFRLFEPIKKEELYNALLEKEALLIQSWIENQVSTDFINKTPNSFELTERGKNVINDLLLSYQDYRDKIVK